MVISSTLQFAFSSLLESPSGGHITCSREGQPAQQFVLYIFLTAN
jgi:hypothetical protein